MSFNLFVGCFKGGEKSFFPRSLIDQAFAPYVTRHEPNYLTLKFQDQGECYLYRDASDLIEGFNINRPVAAGRLFETLFSVLRSESLALYMPGEVPPLIGRQDTAGQLPRAMIESLGSPVMLSSAQEIKSWIERA